MTATLEKAADGPLHERIRAELERRIRSGEWPPGFRIPFEHELMAQYRCSRMTVNKAVAALAAGGLVSRRRRAGTFVERPHVHSAVLTIPDIQAEIVARGSAYEFRLLSRRRRPAKRRDAIEATLGGAEGILALRGLHLAGGYPFALEERLISLTAVPDAAAIDFSSTPPGTWLLGHVPWTEAEHRIAAINVEGETARLLKIKISQACLALERRTWRESTGVTYARQIFPGDLYDLQARFGPGPNQSQRRIGTGDG